MGRNLSPVVRRELANLDKDAESRRSAMKALKSYVKDLDSRAIPLFLAQVSETKDRGSSYGEHTISLYEVLARGHGPKIVPQIDNIMSTIINTLKSSAGSFPLQQACSKVVPAIARYGIDPMAPAEKKSDIIHSLCKPLSDSLLGSQESLAFGAALCLKALVDSDNWRYASDEVVNEVCLKVAGALEEKPTQTNSHMGLVMALAKHNNLIVEAYARSLIRSGLRILNAGVVDGNSQKRLSAIQMVNYLMKSLDIRSVFSELDIVIGELDKCNSDQMAFVRGAAFEALQTAKMLAEERPKLERDSSSVTGSNFSRRRSHIRRKNSGNVGDPSPLSASPESQTVESFVDYDSLAESPTLTGMMSSNFPCNSRSVNRKLWQNDNVGVDVSLKDGLFSDLCRSSSGSNSHFERYESGLNTDNDEQSETFSGFVHLITRDAGNRSATPSPQKTHTQLSIDEIKIFTTPRKLIQSLQEQNSDENNFFNLKERRVSSPGSSQAESSPTENVYRDAVFHSLNVEVNKNRTCSEVGEQASNSYESVSSSGEAVADTNQEVSHEVGPDPNFNSQYLSLSRKSFGKRFSNLLSGLFIFLAVAILVLPVIMIDNQEEAFDLLGTSKIYSFGNEPFLVSYKTCDAIKAIVPSNVGTYKSPPNNPVPSGGRFQADIRNGSGSCSRAETPIQDVVDAKTSSRSSSSDSSEEERVQVKEGNVEERKENTGHVEESEEDSDEESKEGLVKEN
ncbi:hypothetical protein Syun_001623 [Stephania yunnanensis]|uniref:TORTIFOLIA1/SINE1-2 N-terminal domain-containing protein n=1 Tax=Stephania yunnanensis TaxID=152371 RepID=A0AAP0LE61_9MAGN